MIELPTVSQSVSFYNWLKYYLGRIYKFTRVRWTGLRSPVESCFSISVAAKVNRIQGTKQNTTRDKNVTQQNWLFHSKIFFPLSWQNRSPGKRDSFWRKDWVQQNSSVTFFCQCLKLSWNHQDVVKSGVATRLEGVIQVVNIVTTTKSFNILITFTIITLY